MQQPLYLLRYCQYRIFNTFLLDAQKSATPDYTDIHSQPPRSYSPLFPYIVYLPPIVVGFCAMCLSVAVVIVVLLLKSIWSSNMYMCMHTAIYILPIHISIYMQEYVWTGIRVSGSKMPKTTYKS